MNTVRYVFNKSRYALAFEITVAGKERRMEFDRKRLYFDTGNVATTGITPVEDDIYALLLKNKRFKALIDNGELELTEESEIVASNKEAEALKTENEQLKKEIKEAKKASSDKETKKVIEAKDNEISALKAQLESLSKDKGADEATATSETDGF